MSLIDEALKRARMEAAQRAAEGEGLPYPTIPRHLAPRRRRGWLAPLAVLLAVLAGLLIGWMMANRGPQAEQVAAQGGGDGAAVEPSTPRAVTPRTATPRPATPAQMTRDAVATGTDNTEPAGSAASASPRLDEIMSPPAAPEPAAPLPTIAQPVTSGPTTPEDVPRDPPANAPVARRTVETPPAPPAPTRQAAPPPAEPPPGQPPRRETTPSEPLPSAAQPAPLPREPTTAAESTTSTTVTDPDSGVLLVLPERPSPSNAAPNAERFEEPAESHVQSYPLPDGGAIELGGIAWSETGPFALINGRVVGPGSVIDGHTLERIRPGHVVLTGSGRRIHLSLQ